MKAGSGVLFVENEEDKGCSACSVEQTATKGSKKGRLSCLKVSGNSDGGASEWVVQVGNQRPQGC